METRVIAFIRVHSRLILLARVALRADTFYLTIAGLGGEPEYEQRFQRLGQGPRQASQKAEPNAQVNTLLGPGAATTANIEAKLRDFAKQAKPDDSVVLMLIGHGSYDESGLQVQYSRARISRRRSWSNLLDKIPAKHQLMVNMTSASGGVAAFRCEKPNRVVITATKSGTEKNATVFRALLD